MMTEEEKAAEIKKYWDCKNAGSKPYWHEHRLWHCLSRAEMADDEQAAYDCNMNGYDAQKDDSGRFRGCSTYRSSVYIVN
ncbi:hypothetical protein N9X77_02345 [Luminiphilus sp.]|nr:hypothetical protein [Luminiphilus sp.]